MLQKLLESNGTFELFSLDHGLTLLVIAVSITLLILYAKRQTRERQDTILKAMSLIVSGSIISWSILRLSVGIFDYKTDLPFFLCNLLALTIPIVAFTKHPKLFQAYYYIVIAGSTQALLTPALVDNFPHHHFIKFWIAHGGIVAVMLYMVFVFKMRPTLRGVWLSFLFAQVYLVFTFTMNYLLDANYCYLNYKPETGSFLDIFPEWPWYLLVTDVVMMPFFALFYIPFWFADRRQKV